MWNTTLGYNGVRGKKNVYSRVSANFTGRLSFLNFKKYFFILARGKKDHKILRKLEKNPKY